MEEIRYVRITCYDCANQVRVDAMHAGKRVRCPADRCGAINDIPTRDELESLWAQGLSGPPLAAPPTSAAPSTSAGAEHSL